MKPRVPKDLKKYQKHYSEKGLLDKIGKTCRRAGIKVIYYVLLLHYVLTDGKTPLKDKMVIIGALGYFILPLDLIPDIFPIAGFADDAAALVACLKAIVANVTPEIRKKAHNRLQDWFSSVEYTKVEEYDDEYSSTP